MTTAAMTAAHDVTAEEEVVPSAAAVVDVPLVGAAEVDAGPAVRGAAPVDLVVALEVPAAARVPALRVRAGSPEDPVAART